jgi:hypothetical protein
MTDINRKRPTIDATRAEAVAPFRYLDSAGEGLLSDLAFASLGDSFLDFVSPANVPQAKMRARCEDARIASVPAE